LFVAAGDPAVFSRRRLIPQTHHLAQDALRCGNFVLDVLGVGTLIQPGRQARNIARRSAATTFQYSLINAGGRG
jgi:hypothetical protein